MLKNNISFGIFLAFAIMIMTQIGYGRADGSPPHCKELNHVACYAGKNEGYFCSKKDQTTTVTRWFYDKGTCRKFDYKGCYGNRNRFCSKQECEQRCGESSAEAKIVKSLNFDKKILKNKFH